MKNASKTRLHADVSIIFRVHEGLVKYSEETQNTDKASESLVAGLLRKIKKCEGS